MVKTDWRPKRPGPKRLSATAYRKKRHKIFDLLRRGLSSVAVARECGISPRMVGQIMQRGGVQHALSWNIDEADAVLIVRKGGPRGGPVKFRNVRNLGTSTIISWPGGSGASALD
jgi:hypothetical protein